MTEKENDLTRNERNDLFLKLLNYKNELELSKYINNININDEIKKEANEILTPLLL